MNNLRNQATIDDLIEWQIQRVWQCQQSFGEGDARHREEISKIIDKLDIDKIIKEGEEAAIRLGHSIEPSVGSIRIPSSDASSLYREIQSLYQLAQIKDLLRKNQE